MPRAEDVATVELQLLAQLSDELIMLLDGLTVELAGFNERGLKILYLLSKPAQQVVTLLRISRP